MASSFRPRGRGRSNDLGVEGLEPRTVLSGMPIDLGGLAQLPLTRLSFGEPPADSGGDWATDVEATGFSVRLPSDVPNGLPVRALIMAVGADNRPAAFSGEVSLASTDEAARFPETVTLLRGRGYVSVTFGTAGEQTLTVTGDGETPITGSDTTVVAEPIVATELVMRLRESTRLDAPTKVVLMALDANGRSVPSFAGEVSFTSSDEAATLPETVSFRWGRAVVDVTFGTEGDQTLTATSGDLVAEAATTVSPQPEVAAFEIMLREEVVAGQNTRVVAVAVDADGKAIRDFSGSASVSSSDEAATLPEMLRFRGGRAYFQVAFATLGEQQLSVAAGGIKATASTTVSEAPAVASISLWLPGKVIAGLPMLAQLVARDAEGRPVRSFSGTLDVSSSDADAAIPSTVEFVNGVALLRVAFATVGEQTLTVSDPSNPELTATGTTDVKELRLPGRPPWGRLPKGRG
jgi:hypothetical protein